MYHQQASQFNCHDSYYHTVCVPFKSTMFPFWTAYRCNPKQLCLMSLFCLNLAQSTDAKLCLLHIINTASHSFHIFLCFAAIFINFTNHYVWSVYLLFKIQSFLTNMHICFSVNAIFMLVYWAHGGLWLISDICEYVCIMISLLWFSVASHNCFR